VELMIVVSIVAILLAVGLPAYQGSIQKGRRSDAMSAIMDVANREEQFMLDQSRYTADMTELGFAADPALSEEGFYTVDAAAGSCGNIAFCYVVTATPAAGSPQVNDTRCATFSMDSEGARTATGTAAGDCW
jgi:type IV pilus assembly protein PilE